MWSTIPYVMIALQGLVYYQFIKYLKTLKFYKPSYKLWAAVPFIVFNVTFILIRYIWGRDFVPPSWFKYAAVYPFYIWISATFFISLWLLAGKIIKLPVLIPVWIAKLFKPLREKINSFKKKESVQQFDLSRRKFVRYATMGISAYAFGGAAYGMIKHDSYKIEHKDIKIDNLPAGLKGTTITLVSDVHSGQYMDEKEMREYAEIINSLGSDIICMPGDFVNFDIREVYPFISAFRDLKAKHGVYGSLGNHDFFSNNADYVAKAITNETPILVLRNDYRKITINGSDLLMMGVDDTRGGGANMETVMRYYDNAEEKIKAQEADTAGKPRILLCHKPYGFDELAKREIDLVLSGHTHGGQVVPVKLGNFNLSFAAIVSKYVEGLYRQGKSQLYVTRGIGTIAMPIRLNCPPEITVIKLV